MPLLNKSLLHSSIASVLLHGALVAGFSFNTGSKLVREEGSIRLHIQLNNLNIMPEPMQESVSAPLEEEASPEVNETEVVQESELESSSKPVVSSSKSAKAVHKNKPPEPEKSEPMTKAMAKPVTLPSDHSQVTDDSPGEPVSITEQANTVLTESVNKVDPIELWLSELQQRINRHRRYPRQALRRGLEGDVRIKAVINTDGSLMSAEVLSGSHSFHSNSLRSLKLALPFPPPAGTAQPVTMVFTVHYKIE